MNILYDLVTTQFFVGGAAEYIRKVFYTLLKEKDKKKLDLTVIGLVDTSVDRYAYQDLSPEALKSKGIKVADIANSSLKEIIDSYHIHKAFIGAAQYWGKYDVENLLVPTICVIHDLCDEEYNVNKLDDYVLLDNLKHFLRVKFHEFRKGKQGLKRLPPIIYQALNNENFKIITVSNFSKVSLTYNFDYPSEKIEVLYSPERVLKYQDEIDNPKLKELLVNKKRYYLMLNANRSMKNPIKTFHAFNRFQKMTGKDVYLATTGCKEQMFDHHIPMPYLSDSDIVQLIRNCYAFLFPSFFEGFGYPPMEAMHFRKPVLASNTTSIPEVCGNAPLYFSPFYESDIFRCLLSLTDENYEEYATRSCEQYQHVSKRQQHDLQRLIKLLSSNEV